MARYERDYDRDFEGWRHQGPYPSGGMRSDGWGGHENWQGYAGEEGWFGEGYDGMPNAGYDTGFQRGGMGRGERPRGGWGGYGSRSGAPGGGDFRGGYGEDFRGGRGGYGGRGRETGYPGRDFGGYSEGWDDQRGWRRSGGEGGSGRSRARASEIMTENPYAVTPDTKISEIAQKMRDLDVGIIPVVDDEKGRRLKGVITDRDIAIRAVAEGKDGSTAVRDCMTDHVRSVNKNDSVQEVMQVMRRDQIRRVPVTDREGRLVGIIAQADLTVDYASDDRSREIEVEDTIERISAPAAPRRGGQAISASER